MKCVPGMSRESPMVDAVSGPGHCWSHVEQAQSHLSLRYQPTPVHLNTTDSENISQKTTDC